MPAGAAQPEKHDYVVAECFLEPLTFEAWVSGPVMHISGSNLYGLYLEDGDGWTMIGTNVTYPSGMMAVEGSPVPKAAPFRGRFSMESSIGDFEGTWSWGMSGSGRAVGRSTDGSALLKLSLYEGAASYEEVTGVPMPDETCGVTTYHVMAK